MSSQSLGELWLPHLCCYAARMLQPTRSHHALCFISLLLPTDAIERDRTQEEDEIKRMEQQAAEALQQARAASAAAAGAAPAEAAAAAAGTGAGGAGGSGAGGGGVATTLQLSAAEAVSCGWLGLVGGRGGRYSLLDWRVARQPLFAELLSSHGWLTARAAAPLPFRFFTGGAL